MFVACPTHHIHSQTLNAITVLSVFESICYAREYRECMTMRLLQGVSSYMNWFLSS